jgi:hypothetical protein
VVRWAVWSLTRWSKIAMNSKAWVFRIDYEHPTIETLWVVRKNSVVILERLYTQFLSGPPNNPTSNHKSGSRSRWVKKLSSYLSFQPSVICILEEKSQQIQKNNNLKKNCWKQYNTYKVLSSAIHELSHFFLVVINPHVRFYKKLHWAWFTSKNCSLQEKIVVS